MKGTPVEGIIDGAVFSRAYPYMENIEVCIDHEVEASLEMKRIGYDTEYTEELYHISMETFLQMIRDYKFEQVKKIVHTYLVNPVRKTE